MLGFIATLMASTPILSHILAAPLFARAAYYRVVAEWKEAASSNIWGK